MIVEVEHQRQGVDLIKIDNDETKIIFRIMEQSSVLEISMIIILFLEMLLKRMSFIIVITFKFGASMGRYSGRIDNAKFRLKGKNIS